MQMIKRSLIARLFLTLLIILGLALLSKGQVEKCADFNEYCQNHWDCCSNTCLSYLYRCTQNFAIFPYSFLGKNYAPPVESTLQEIYDLNFGSVIARTEVFALPQGIYGRFGGEEEDDIDENSSMIRQSLKAILLPKTTTATAPPTVTPSTVKVMTMQTTELPETKEIRAPSDETTTKLIEMQDLSTEMANIETSSLVMPSTVRTLAVETVALPVAKEISTAPGETTVMPLGTIHTANAKTTTTTTTPAAVENASEVGIKEKKEEK